MGNDSRGHSNGGNIDRAGGAGLESMEMNDRFYVIFTLGMIDDMNLDQVTREALILDTFTFRANTATL